MYLAAQVAQRQVEIHRALADVEAKIEEASSHNELSLVDLLIQRQCSLFDELETLEVPAEHN